MNNNITFYPAGVRDSKGLFIGSSDIAVIIKTKGSHVKKSMYELWKEKTGRAKGFEGNEATWWGHEHEPLVLARQIKETHGDDIAFKFKCDAIIHQNFRPPEYQPPTDFLPYTEAIHPKFPWAMAHADCLAVNDGEPYLLEAKTGRFFSRVERDNMEGFNIVLDDEIDDWHKVPADVLLQVQWQMICYGVDLAYVLLLVDDNQFFRYRIPAFKKWWPFMIEKASRFLNYCINDEMPPPEKKEDVFDIFDEVKDSAVYVSGDRALILEDMKARKKHLGKVKKKAVQEIEDINDAATLLMGDNRFVYSAETSSKLFSQSLSKGFTMVHKSKMDKEDAEKYTERGLITEYDNRKVN